MRLMIRYHALRAAVLCSVIAMFVTASACAARGPRNQARVGALTIGEAALALNQAEYDLYAANLYPKATHDLIGGGLLKVLHAVRGYERAVAQWRDGDTKLQAVDDARAAILAALTDFQAVIPEAAAIRDPLLRALAALQAVLATPTALIPTDVPMQAQLPGGLMAFLAFAQIIAQLLASGRTTWEKLKAAIQREGATDEELEALDLQLSAAIDRREQEQRPGG